MNFESLRKRRLRQGLTIEELAGRIQVTPATLSRWERNKRTPRRAFLRLWRQALNKKEERE